MLLPHCGNSQSVLTDSILQGNGYTLVNAIPAVVQPDEENNLAFRFWFGDWRKHSVTRPGGDQSFDDNNYASREEIMMVLENIEQILIR